MVTVMRHCGLLFKEFFLLLVSRKMPGDQNSIRSKFQSIEKLQCCEDSVGVKLHCIKLID